MTKKTALEQALLEADEILSMVTVNAKDMLYNQIKPAISQNITEGFEDLADDKKDDVVDAPVADTEVAPEGGEEVVADEPVVADAEPEGDVDPLNGDAPSIDGEPAVEVPAMDGGDDEDVMDMTGASDEELISVWKKVGDDAEIQVVKNDDNSVNITTPQGEEFLIKLNENEEAILAEFDTIDQKFGAVEEDKYSFVDKINGEAKPEDSQETIFEIVMDEEEAPLTETPAAIQEEEPIEEVARTHADGRNMTRKPEGFYKYAQSRLRPALAESVDNDKVVITEAETLKGEKAQLLTENELLKGDLEKHKDALRLMKENLEKVALFNSKLAYVNKIFCEHATTNDEKKTILERFDDEEAVKSQQDVKTLYKTISTEMKQTKTIKESVEEKIGSNSVSGTGEPLLESVSPEKSAEQAKLDRIKKIMNYQPGK